MLRQHSHFMITGLVIADACAVAVAWLASYWIRFTWLPVDLAKGVPPLAERFLPLLPLVVLVHLVSFYRLRLYRPRRDQSLFAETRDVIKAFVVAVVAVVLIDYALPQTNKISRQFILTYALVGTALFALFRASVRALLQELRRRGWNQRTAAIVGSGRTAQRLLYALQRHSWIGVQVQYFVDDSPGEPRARSLRGIPVRGPLHKLRNVVEAAPVDAVFVALPIEQAHRTEEILAALETSMADVRVVPAINPIYAMRPDVSDLDGLPILSLRQSPLYGWNAIAKRAFDVMVGGACLLVAALPMGLLALLIKLDSRGPVFYRQRRMGLDGREFDMLKFRTMRTDAEATGPIWSQRNDPRRTRLGVLLRRTSLDELPNLFNVLRGEMSLVGPRPERPEFIEEFKREVPRYMLRHKMKAGMTGYAQVQGYRGDTSLRKRIQHDVYYIRHWSLWMDVVILARTLVGVWFSRHEHEEPSASLR